MADEAEDRRATGWSCSPARTSARRARSRASSSSADRVDRRRRQRRQEAPAGDQVDDAGRDHRQGHADPRVERGDRCARRVARPRRLPLRRRRQQGRACARSAGRTSDAPRQRLADVEQAEPRCEGRQATTTRSAPALQQELGLANVMEVPRLDKIVLNCGVGARDRSRRRCSTARSPTSTDHHRPEAARHQGEEVDRRLQAP